MRRPGIALVAVLATLVICTLLLVTSIRLISYQRSHHLVQRQKLLARIAAESGLEFIRAEMAASSQPGQFISQSNTRRQISPAQAFEVDISFRRGYPFVRVQGFSGEESHTIEAYLGSGIYPNGEMALIIKESPGPVYASGNTKIQGDVWVPRGTIEAKELHEVPAANLPIVRGRLRSQPITPEIEPWASHLGRRSLREAESIQVGIAKVPREGIWSLNGDTHKFDKSIEIPAHLTAIKGPGRILVRGDIVFQGNLTIDGNAELVASERILSDSNLNLAASLLATDIKLVAAKGQALLIARGSLEMGEGTDLRPPSVACLIDVPEMKKTGNFRLLLRAGKFAGTLFTWANDDWTLPTIRIEPEVEASGYIYASGNLDLRAPFKGHIYAHTFQSYKGSRVFENWLKDIQINRQPKSIAWPLPPGFNGPVEVVAWQNR